MTTKERKRRSAAAAAASSAVVLRTYVRLVCERTSRRTVRLTEIASVDNAGTEGTRLKAKNGAKRRPSTERTKNCTVGLVQLRVSGCRKKLEPTSLFVDRTRPVLTRPSITPLFRSQLYLVYLFAATSN